MPGFLSQYTDIERIDLGGGYWVDIKKYLTSADASAAQRALTRPKVRSKIGEKSSELEGDTDIAAYHEEMVLRSVVEWNLDDENGKVLPMNRETYRKLPQAVVNKLVQRIGELQGEGGERSSEEANSFRSESVASDLRGEGTAA